MTVLLDTHAVLWAALTPPMLGRRASAIIANPANKILVSAVTAYEIANKVRKGALPGAEDLEHHFMERMAEAGFTVLPLGAEVALEAGRLPGEHRDPWDRLIAAQALLLGVPVLSIDAQLDAFGIRRIW